MIVGMLRLLVRLMRKCWLGFRISFWLLVLLISLKMVVVCLLMFRECVVVCSLSGVVCERLVCGSESVVIKVLDLVRKLW